MSGYSSLPGRCTSRADRPVAQQRLHTWSSQASPQKPVQARTALCKAATLERQIEIEPDSVPEPRITREILAPPASGQLLDQGTAFCEEHRVRAYEVSPDQRATIVTIANLIQAIPQLSSSNLLVALHSACISMSCAVSTTVQRPSSVLSLQHLIRFYDINDTSSLSFCCCIQGSGCDQQRMRGEHALHTPFCDPRGLIMNRVHAERSRLSFRDGKILKPSSASGQ